MYLYLSRAHVGVAYTAATMGRLHSMTMRIFKTTVKCLALNNPIYWNNGVPCWVKSACIVISVLVDHIYLIHKSE